VPSEPLQPRGMGTALHSNGERAALEAVVVELAQAELSLDRAGPSDQPDRLAGKGQIRSCLQT